MSWTLVYSQIHDTYLNVIPNIILTITIWEP